MRKQTVIAQCDGPGCTRYAEMAEMGDHPAGWFQIKPIDEHGKLDRNYLEFHSLKCVAKWARDRAAYLRSNNGHHTDAAEDVMAAFDLGQHEMTSKDVQEATGLVQSTVDRWLNRHTEEGRLVCLTGGPHKVYRKMQAEEG